MIGRIFGVILLRGVMGGFGGGGGVTTLEQAAVVIQVEVEVVVDWIT